MFKAPHLYEVRPRKDHRGVDLIFDALPFGRLWYGDPNAIKNAIGYAEHRSRSHRAVIRVYDSAGNVIETYQTRASSESGRRTSRNIMGEVLGSAGVSAWVHICRCTDRVDRRERSCLRRAKHRRKGFPAL